MACACSRSIFTVNWGDDSEETITSNSDLSHTYSNSGDYSVRIDGTFPRIMMGRPIASPNNLISINNWGNIEWVSMNNAFRDCINLYRCNPSDTPDLSNVSTLQEMFKNAGSNIPTLIIDNINKWDVSNIINMRSMFQSSPFKGNISNWNTSNVTRMDTMFNFNTLFNININSWDVSKVQFMQGMFNGATSFNQPLDNWTLRSAGVNINSIFRNASSFNQNINSWDISGVTNLQQLFSGATSFNKPLNNWDTSEVTNMDAVFKNASSFNQPLNNWNVSNVTTTSQMFQNATSFNQPLNSWETNAYSTTSNIENMSFMFDGATSFIASLNSWDTSGATNISYMFRNINDTGGNIDVSSWDTSNVIQSQYTFAFNPNSSPDLTSWDVSSMENIQSMLQGTSFNSDIKQWNISNVTNANNIFNNALQFNIELDKWNASKICHSSLMHICLDVETCSELNIFTGSKLLDPIFGTEYSEHFANNFKLKFPSPRYIIKIKEKKELMRIGFKYELNIIGPLQLILDYL